MRGKPAPGSRSPPKSGARRSAAIPGTARGPAARPPPPSCPMRPGVLAYHRRDNVPGQIRAQIRPPGPSAKITQGARPLQQEPTMQPNTVNNHHNTEPARPARAAGGTGPGPGRGAHPAAPAAPAAGNGAGRGLPDRRAARPAAGRLPGDGPAAGDRRGAAAHRGVPRRPENDPPLPAAVRRGVRGQRPGGSRPGRLRRRLAGAGHRARTVTARQPRHRTLAAPARFAARWRELAACRGTDLDVFFPGRGESAGPARQVCAQCPVRQPCLDYAITNRIIHGIWGGLTERERRALRSRWVRASRRERDRAIRPPTRPGTPQAAIGRAFGLSRTSVSRVLSRDPDRRRS